MGMTTIKVDTSTREMLRELAKEQGVTVDAALKALLVRERRRRRLEAARVAMASNPLDANYSEELKQWESGAWN